MVASNVIVGHLKSGEPVRDRLDSHVHGDQADLLGQALERVDGQGRPFLLEEINFGRVVGQSVCVETSASDRIVFAQRPGRRGLSRFVENRCPEDCSSVVVILKKEWNEEGYLLVTSFVGRKPEHEPWDRHAGPASFEFWAGHALVWGSEPIVPGSETPDCPW